ncbi:MAG TPA: polymer-forming cytoskeletal protein [Steroidobacteraceae bacterium]
MSAAHDLSKDKASILGPTLKFKGELSSQEDLVIHGHVEGTIGPAPKVTIGPEAVIKAGVTAEVIVVEGNVEGDLKAHGSITVRARANVRGNLEAPAINVAEGATLNGSIKMEPRRADGYSSSNVTGADSSFARTGTGE